MLLAEKWPEVVVKWPTLRVVSFLVQQSIEQFVQTVKGQNNFWQQNAFLTCFWKFLRSNKSEQLEFKLEKNIGVQKHAGKVRKENEIRDFRNFSTNRIDLRKNALKKENKTRANSELFFSFSTKFSLDTYIFSFNLKYT